MFRNQSLVTMQKNRVGTSTGNKVKIASVCKDSGSFQRPARIVVHALRVDSKGLRQQLPQETTV